MTKFDLDTLRPLCKSIFDHWRKAGKTDTNTINDGKHIITFTIKNATRDLQK